MFAGARPWPQVFPPGCRFALLLFLMASVKNLIQMEFTFTADPEKRRDGSDCWHPVLSKERL
jgi:hypothetical protein